MAEINYIVKGDQRWDSISTVCYGSPFLMGDIIRNNPDVPIDLIVPSGTSLMVPIVETTAVVTAKESLPPWKR